VRNAPDLEVAGGVRPWAVIEPADSGRISRRSLLIGGAGAVVVIGAAGAGFDHELGQHPGLRADVFGCGSTPAIPHSNYTVSTGAYRSTAMHAELPWEVAIPWSYVSNPRLSASRGPLPLVVVLPGEGGQPADMVTRIGLPGWASAARLDLAFASPGGAGSTYYHPRADGTNAFAWVTEEFLPMIERKFTVGGSRANRAVYGNSMGGFGALLVAQQRPDLVCAAVGSSPAVFPTYHAAITGHPHTFDSAADWERWGLWEDLGALDKVPVRIDCGNGDPFEATARTLLARIPGAVGAIGGGCHDDGFWRREASIELRFLDEHLTSSAT
jgi:pimeloyl-ACP methyl ester carboxylesterase